MTRKTSKNARETACDKDLLSNERFSIAVDCHKEPSFLFYSVDMGVPFGKRGKAEVLSVVRNRRMRCRCHGGGLYFLRFFARAW
jgi:hypothetical protein